MFHLSEIDQRTAAALAAKAKTGDGRARNMLYLMIAPQLEGLFRWGWRRCSPELYSLDDVRQEGYIAFCQVMERWKGGDFFRTFFGLMRWLLKRRTEGWGKPMKALVQGPSIPPWEARVWEGPVYEAIRDLPNEERRIAEACLIGGLTVSDAARRLGMSRRTAYRRWHAVRERMRRWYLGLL